MKIFLNNCSDIDQDQSRKQANLNPPSYEPSLWISYELSKRELDNGTKANQKLIRNLKSVRIYRIHRFKLSNVDQYCKVLNHKNPNLIRRVSLQ